MASNPQNHYGPAPAERGENDENKTGWANIGTSLTTVPNIGGQIDKWPWFDTDTAGRDAYLAALEANRAKETEPRQPPPTREEAEAIFARIKTRVDVLPYKYSDHKRRQKMAESLQTWMAETTHASPRGPHAGRPLRSSEKDSQIRARLAVKSSLQVASRTRVVCLNGSLMRERSEWHDWRLIAGTDYWECPKCKEFIHTNDVKLHKISHPVLLGRFPNS